jgi:hypothetical protein
MWVAQEVGEQLEVELHLSKDLLPLSSTGYCSNGWMRQMTKKAKTINDLLP